jgi:hypothetical protein
MQIYNNLIPTGNTAQSAVIDTRSAVSLGVKSNNAPGTLLGWGVEVSDDGATGWAKMPLGFQASGVDILAAPWMRSDGPTCFVVDVTPFAFCRVLIRNDSGASIGAVVSANVIRSR